MSWSFYAVGKPAAVLALAKKELGQLKCIEPEETVKTLFLATLETTLNAMLDSAVVQVRGCGSQAPVYVNSKLVDGKASNSLKIDIEPLYNFVE